MPGSAGNQEEQRGGGGSTIPPADTPPPKRVRRDGNGSCSPQGNNHNSSNDSDNDENSGTGFAGGVPARGNDSTTAMPVDAGASTNATDDASPSTASSLKTAASSPPASATARSPNPGPVAKDRRALLRRWEDVLLADTLRASLDPAVARAKRVLHLAELEEELRGEPKQDGSWSLDSKSFFERLLLARLNHPANLEGTGDGGAAVIPSPHSLSSSSPLSPSSSSIGVSPLGYMISCYERAVQAGKGPTPRHHGKPVGEARDAALRQLREVLVTYSILTIQNPDMWGDEDSVAGKHPIAELKSLFKEKGAAGLPQGLLDDFIRVTTPSADVDGAGTAGGVTLEELFQPLLLSLLEDAAGCSSAADPMAAAGEFSTVIQALMAIVEKKPLAGLFARLPGWIPEPWCSGQVLEEQSPLGMLFAFKPTKATFKVGTVDLVIAGTDWTREKRPSREENQALHQVLTTSRKSLASVREALVGLTTTLLKAKQAREPVLRWMAAVANHNRGRERDGFHQGFEQLPVSSEGMLSNLLYTLLRLCEPFLTVGDPKAEALAEKTDLDYFRGSDRIDASDDTEVWSDPNAASEGSTESGGGGTGIGGGGGGGNRASWLDQRNQSRIAQFEARRAALLASASSTSPADASAPSGGGCDDAETAEMQQHPQEKTFGTTAEFAGLTARVLHVGVGQAQKFWNATNRRVERWRDGRDAAKKELESGDSLSAHDKRELQRRVKNWQSKLETGSLSKLVLQLVAMDPEVVVPSLRFLRFQAARLIKHASVGRGVVRNTFGEPLPPLPMPPPPNFAMLPAHLMEDVADMIKFAAYTCVPDNRSGLTPLETISPLEASGFLSFLVLFIGTSGYMRNPYLRAKMVEALVAFLPAEGEKGRSRRGKDPFGSLFSDHPVACEYLGPQLLEFFVDIEFTGSHTQFYDKFTFRSLTAQLLEYLWTLTPYRESIIRYSEDGSKFVRFANMVINDSIFHMDDAMKKLSTIKAAQVRAADQTLTDEQRREAREEAEAEGRNAKYFLKEAKVMMRMLAYMTESINDAFMVDELRARTAEMLGYFLDHLVGKKSKDLKVDNMAELGWRPREVLGTLVDVYLNLSTCEPFAAAVAGDERSYKREIFVRAGEVIAKIPTDGSPASEPRVVNAFRAFADKVEAAFKELSQAAEELGDIPDSFMCPIGCDLMRDPVTLPTSGQVVDRAAITRHLLSDAMDPYNRKPLTVEMLEPNDALREEIEEWIRQQRNRSREERLNPTIVAAPPTPTEPDTPPPAPGGNATPLSPPDIPAAQASDTSSSAMDISPIVGIPAPAPVSILPTSTLPMSAGSSGSPPPPEGVVSAAVSSTAESSSPQNPDESNATAVDAYDDEEEMLLQQALALSLDGSGDGAGGGGQEAT